MKKDLCVATRARVRVEAALLKEARAEVKRREKRLNASRKARKACVKKNK